MQFEGFLQVGKSLFLGLALAGYIEFQALGDVPLPLTPNGRSEWSLPDPIVSQAGLHRTVSLPESIDSARQSGMCRGIPRDDFRSAVYRPESGEERAMLRSTRMELAIRIQVEELPKGVFLATSDELPGLVAQGRTVAEALEIARDVARKLIEARRERDGLPNLPTTRERRDYTIVVAA